MSFSLVSFFPRGETILMQILSKQCLSEREPRDTLSPSPVPRDSVRSSLVDVPTVTLTAPWKNSQPDTSDPAAAGRSGS